MNKNKAIRKILFIIFILIIIGILAPIYSKATTYETFSSDEEEFWVWGSNSAWTLSTAGNEEITSVVSSVTEVADGTEDIILTFDEIEESWYWLCCAADQPLINTDLDLYGFIECKYSFSETLIANPAEAYQLSSLNQGNTDFDSLEQYAWWATYIGGIGSGSASSDYSYFAQGSLFQNYTFYMMDWSSSYNNQSSYIYGKYSDDYTTYDVNGLSITAPDIKSVVDETVKFSDNIDLDNDGLTRADGDVDDEITINYDSEEDAYIIGPFMLEYKEYYEYQNGGVVHYEGSTSGMTEAEIDAFIQKLWNQTGGEDTKKNYDEFYSLVRAQLNTNGGNYSYDVDDKDAFIYAGVIGICLETNLSTDLEYGVDYWLEYETANGESSVTGMPAPEEIFYLCVKYEEGFTQITKFCFNYEYYNAGAEVETYEGYCYKCYNCGTYFPYYLGDYIHYHTKANKDAACAEWRKVYNAALVDVSGYAKDYFYIATDTYCGLYEITHAAEDREWECYVYYYEWEEYEWVEYEDDDDDDDDSEGGVAYVANLSLSDHSNGEWVPTGRTTWEIKRNYS